MTQLPATPFIISARLALTTPDGGLPLGSLFGEFGQRWVAAFGREPLVVPAEDRNPPFAVFSDASKANNLELLTKATTYHWDAPRGEVHHRVEEVVARMAAPLLELLALPSYRATRVSLALEWAKVHRDPRAELVDELLSAKKHGQLVATATKLEAHMLHLEDDSAGKPLHVWTRLRSDRFAFGGEAQDMLRLHQEISTAPERPRDDLDAAALDLFLRDALALAQERRDSLGYR